MSLRQAMQPDAELANVGHAFKVTTCDGISKLFTELSTWELLNLKSKTVLDLPDRLVNEYGIAPKYIETVSSLKLMIEVHSADIATGNAEVHCSVDG